jgi:type II secretory pathway pseudopilin PulG
MGIIEILILIAIIGLIVGGIGWGLYYRQRRINKGGE